MNKHSGGPTSSSHFAEVHRIYSKGKPNLWKLEDYRREMRANPTLIEKKMKKILDAMNLDYEFQKIIGSYIVDFFIETERLVLETDGASWHKTRDLERDKFIAKKGYRVLHILGWQVCNEPIAKGLINDFLGRVAITSPSAG